MIINQQPNYTSWINPNTSILTEQLRFTILEHAYFEFSDQIMSVHKHRNRMFDDTNLIYYMIEGSGRISMKDGTMPIVPGKIYFCPSVKQEPYQAIFYPGTKKVHIMFYCKLFSNQDIFSHLTSPVCLNDDHHLIPMIRDAVLSENPGKQSLLSPLVQLSVAPMFTQFSKNLQVQIANGHKYRSLFDYIEEHPYVDLKISQIANETSFSVYVLTHAIPKELDITLKKYITTRILQKVCFELIYSKTLIRDIAYKYHFSTEGYFSDWFFKHTANRPKEYRQKFKVSENYSFYEKTDSELSSSQTL